jgi:peptide/nickel transport system permease protein
MRRYVISRLLMSIPTMLGVSILVFSMMHLIPGDPVSYMVRNAPNIDVELMRQRLGLNLPVHVQYWRFLTRAVRGDLGMSIFIKRPVLQMIMMELPYTIRLASLGWMVTVTSGLVFGILAALTAGSWLDTGITAIAVAGMCLPGFWLAMILIWVFCVRLGWFPIFGEESVKVLVLPVIVIGFGGSAMISRVTRSGLLEALGQDYIRTARAKGLAERAVIIKHALKNALMPVVTIAGLDLAGLLGGTVLVETVFGRRGIGNLALRAILQRDYPLAQGLVLFVAVVYVGANVIIDFVYAYIDPRIRYE